MDVDGAPSQPEWGNQLTRIVVNPILESYPDHGCLPKGALFEGFRGALIRDKLGSISTKGPLSVVSHIFTMLSFSLLTMSLMLILVVATGFTVKWPRPVVQTNAGTIERTRSRNTLATHDRPNIGGLILPLTTCLEFRHSLSYQILWDYRGCGEFYAIRLLSRRFAKSDYQPQCKR